MEFPAKFSNGIIVEDVVMDSGACNDEACSSIDIVYKIANYPDYMPFTASPRDVEEHGRALYKAATEGYFGGIKPYVPTPAHMAAKVQALTNEATQKINQLQTEVDILQDAVDEGIAEPEEEERLPIAKTELSAWKRYRVYLSRVPAQPGYPTKIDWPVKPA